MAVTISMLKNFEEKKAKWDQYHKKFRLNSARWATIILTVENTIELLEGKREGRVLDIGCGSGEIDILLARKTNFNIIGCDISETAIKIAQKNVQRAGLEDQIQIERGDVYNLKYPNNYFDIILSFGYVSAATYSGVQKEVARALKPNGILICDFINCFSLYKFFYTIKRIIKGKKPYYLTLRGIRHEFKKADLIFINQRFFNSYPPINLKLNPRFFLTFENTIGKIFKNFLGRVRLVSFSKIGF